MSRPRFPPLRHNLRPTDFIVRYGGEEFIAILPDTSLDTAVKVAERIRQAWAHTQLPIDDQGKVISGTVSIGVVWPCGASCWR